MTTLEDKISSKSPIEREKFIMKNVNFIKDFLNEIITNNSIDIFGEKRRKKIKLVVLQKRKRMLKLQISSHFFIIHMKAFWFILKL